jgi:hypothetical protein
MGWWPEISQSVRRLGSGMGTGDRLVGKVTRLWAGDSSVGKMIRLRETIKVFGQK